MQCPVCLTEDTVKKKVPLVTDGTSGKGSVIDVVSHTPKYDQVKVGLKYNGFSQLYADVCTKCGYVERMYIVP